MLGFLAGLCAIAAGAGRAIPVRSDTVEAGHYRLYKFQQAIGDERYVIMRDAQGIALSVNFAFTDRGQRVPLEATLLLGPDGTPRHLGIAGRTSRMSTVNDTVDLGARMTTLRVGEETRSITPVANAFPIAGYAPIALQQALLRFWASHGRPDTVPTLPTGRVAIAFRGLDTVAMNGTPVVLQRIGIRGLIWGRETAWMDDAARLVAVITTDAEFDHFEAIRDGFEAELGRFVARAAADGAEALSDLTAGNAADTGDFALVGGTLIDGSDAAPVRDAVVVVRQGRIVAAGPRGRVRVPRNVPTVNIAGRFVLPGLWDMHAHYEQVEWGPIYLAAGVTTVRDVGNEFDFIRSVRATIAAGRGIGPRILNAGVIDGTGAFAIGVQQAATPTEGIAFVDAYHAAGFEQIKIYSSMSLPVLAAVAREAHRLGMTVTGHVPIGLTTFQAVDSGMDQINHIQFIRAMMLPPREPGGPPPTLDINGPEAQRAIAFLALHHTVIDPTLALSEAMLRPASVPLSRYEPGADKIAPEIAALTGGGMPPERVAYGAQMIADGLAIVGALHRAGVPIVAGTDQAVPGHSLHREIELHVQAGFTPLEAIQSATIVPARAMHLDGESGTAEAGKRADLIVVDADPLQDIANLRRIVLVVANGLRYRPDHLWRSVGFQP